MTDAFETNMLPLIEGKIDPQSPAGKQALEAAGLSLTDLKQLQTVSAKLDLSGDERSQAAAASQTITDAPGADRVSDIITGLAAGKSLDTESRPLRRHWNWILPVAGLLMLLPLILNQKGASNEIMLGNRGVHVDFTDEAASGYGPIEFKSDTVTAESQLIMSIFDGTDVVRVTPLFQYTLDSSPWSDSEQQLLWPDKVHVRVEVQMSGQSGAPYGWVERSRD